MEREVASRDSMRHFGGPQLATIRPHAAYEEAAADVDEKKCERFALLR